MKNTLMALALLLVVGCASKPYSIIDGSKSKPNDPENFDVFFTGIDRKMYPDGFSYKKLEPGIHLLQVVTTKSGSRNRSSYLPFMLEAKPCKRYILTAQHDNTLYSDNYNWSVHLLRVESIPSCVADNPGIDSGSGESGESRAAAAASHLQSP